MKFKQYGYTEKKIEVRKMTMGAVIMTIAQAQIRKNVKDMEIRIVDCFMGEVDVYNGMDDLLSKDWSSTYEINVYDWTVMYDKRNDKYYIKIIIADNVEMTEGEE